MKIVFAGGTGFLGRSLAAWFQRSENSGDKPHDLVVLSRNPEADIRGARVLPWNGRNLDDWARELDGADAVINLAGRSVNCRATPANRERMMNSRVDSTRVIGEAIAACSKPPPVWFNSSTATIYRHTYGAPHGELGEIGSDPSVKDQFAVEIAQAWEAALDKADVQHTRKIAMRISIIFDRQPGTIYAILSRLARLGLGGRMGDGRQFVSWMHIEDFCRAIDWLLRHQNCRGVYNLAAPHPLTNADMMQQMREHVGRKFGLPASRWMLEIGAFFMRTETELILKSRRVIPERLLDEGFVFQYSSFDKALESFR